MEARSRQNILRRRKAALAASASASASPSVPASAGASRAENGVGGNSGRGGPSPARTQNAIRHTTPSRNKPFPVRPYPADSSPASLDDDGRPSLLQRRSLEPLTPITSWQNTESGGLVGRTYIKVRTSSEGKATPSKDKGDATSSRRAVHDRARAAVAAKKMHRRAGASPVKCEENDEDSILVNLVEAGRRTPAGRASPAGWRGRKQSLPTAATTRESPTRRVHRSLRDATPPKRTSPRMGTAGGVKSRAAEASKGVRRTPPRPKHPASSTDQLTKMTSSLSISPAMQKMLNKYGTANGNSVGGSSSSSTTRGAERFESERYTTATATSLTPVRLAHHKRYLKEHPSKAPPREAFKTARAAGNRPSSTGRWEEVMEMKRGRRSVSAAPSRGSTACASGACGALDRVGDRGSRKTEVSTGTFKKTSASPARGYNPDSIASLATASTAAPATASSPVPPVTRTIKGQHAVANLARRHRNLSSQKATGDGATPKSRETAITAALSSSSSSLLSSSSAQPMRPPASTTRRALADMHRRRGRGAAFSTPNRHRGDSDCALKASASTCGASTPTSSAAKSLRDERGKLLEQELEVLSRINLSRGSRSASRSASRCSPKKPQGRWGTGRSPSRDDSRTRQLSRRLNRMNSLPRAVSNSSSSQDLVTAGSADSIHSVPSIIDSSCLQSVPSGLESVASGVGVTQSSSFASAGAGSDELPQSQVRSSYAQIQMKRRRAREVLARRNQGR